MSVKREVYDKEFKLRAVRMSYETSDMPQLAKELGMRVELLYRWRAEMSKEESKRFPGHGNKATSPFSHAADDGALDPLSSPAPYCRLQDVLAWDCG